MVWLLFVALRAWGQIERSRSGYPERPLFYVDTASFRSHVRGQSRLEIYTKVSHSQLLFQKEGEVFLSSVQTSVALFDGEEQADGGLWSDRIVSPTYEDTRAAGLEQIRQYTFLIRPGGYTLVVQMRDVFAQKASRIEKEIEVPAYGEESLQLSEVEFAQRIGLPSDSTRTASLHPSAGEPGIREAGGRSSIPLASEFMKGTRQVIPVVQRVYGETLLTLMVYTEVYGWTPEAPLMLEYRVYDQANTVALRCLEMVQGGLEEGTEIDSSGAVLKAVWLDVADVSEGTYRLEMVARKEPSGGQARTSGTFQIRRSYRALFKTNPKEVIEHLRYIASEKELQALQSHDEPERMEAWDQFWRRRAPFSQTVALQEEYYQRVRYTDAQFTNGLRPGWKTDQGGIYILYGPPDEVQRHPFEVGQKPYEIWRYYEINQEFVFIDQDGFSEYRLQDQPFGKSSRRIGW